MDGNRQSLLTFQLVSLFLKISKIKHMAQWRSQKFGLGDAVGQFWLKKLINIEVLYIKG
jgi:hypothetical protein